MLEDDSSDADAAAVAAAAESLLSLRGRVQHEEKDQPDASDSTAVGRRSRRRTGAGIVGGDDDDMANAATGGVRGTYTGRWLQLPRAGGRPLPVPRAAARFCARASAADAFAAHARFPSQDDDDASLGHSVAASQLGAEYWQVV
jgi:hypothetical protein